MIVKLAAERGISPRWFSNSNSFHGPSLGPDPGDWVHLALAPVLLMSWLLFHRLSRVNAAAPKGPMRRKWCNHKDIWAATLKTLTRWFTDLKGRKETEREKETVLLVVRGSKCQEVTVWNMNVKLVLRILLHVCGCASHAFVSPHKHCSAHYLLQSFSEQTFLKW